VLASIAHGHTNSAIAGALVLTRHAVEKHINSIFTKLGLSGDTDTHPPGPRGAALPGRGARLTGLPPVSRPYRLADPPPRR
jgi:hypothetical protein